MVGRRCKLTYALAKPLESLFDNGYDSSGALQQYSDKWTRQNTDVLCLFSPSPLHLEPGRIHGWNCFLCSAFHFSGSAECWSGFPDAPQRNTICLVLRVLATVGVVDYDIVGGALGFGIEGRAGVSCLLPSPSALSMAGHLPTLSPPVLPQRTESPQSTVPEISLCRPGCCHRS